MRRTAALLLLAVVGSSVTAQSIPSPLPAQTPTSAADVHRQEQAIARELLTRDQLSAADISRVLTASHGAMYDRTFRVTFLEHAGSNEGLVEFQMGLNGRPRYQYSKDNYWGEELFYDYTGERPYFCSSVPLTGELFILYVTQRANLNPVDRAVLPDDGFVSDGAGGRIRVVADVRDSRSPFAEEFEMYTNERPLTVGPRATIDGHIARAFVTHHELRPYARQFNDVVVPYPPELQDWLWIDTESLFLVRWEIRRAGVSIDYGIVFTEQPNTQLRPPKLPGGLTIPMCVDLLPK